MDREKDGQRGQEDEDGPEAEDDKLRIIDSDVDNLVVSHVNYSRI